MSRSVIILSIMTLTILVAGIIFHLINYDDFSLGWLTGVMSAIVFYGLHKILNTKDA